MLNSRYKLQFHSLVAIRFHETIPHLCQLVLTLVFLFACIASLQAAYCSTNREIFISELKRAESLEIIWKRE